jgi:hypothetical protein
VYYTGMFFVTELPGMDFGEIGADGRLRKIVGFF